MKALVSIAFLVACGGGKGGAVFDPDGGGSGIQCGGFAGTPCSGDEWCDFGRDDCGGADNTGICKPRPLACDDIFDPVCGCDGEVHPNACDAQAIGVDLDAFGGCKLEPGAFACGPRQCDIASELCHVFGNDIAGEPDGFSCEPLPTGCGSCDCFDNVGCNDQCEGDQTGGFTVTCFGG